VSRPPRIEFAGVPSTTSWRVEIEGIRFSGMIEIDGSFWAIFAEGAERYRVKVDCYVLMENHFHLVVMPPQGNLSQRMHPTKDCVHGLR
jgi:hypothetical protein